jgi:prepilin-type N-terminal cleavage/methylation domain-containing protein
VNAVHDENGMTIIEMMIATALLGIVVGPITISLMLSLITNTSTRERIADSVSAQLLSTYAVVDIQSSKFIVDMAAASPAPTPVCAVAGDSVRLRLRWDDPDPAATAPSKTTIVSYAVRAGGIDGADQLRRVQCDGSGTIVGDAQVVSSLDNLTVACVRADASTGCPTTEEIAGSGASPVREVTLQVRARSPKANSVAYDPYTFEFVIARRVTEAPA